MHNQFPPENRSRDVIVRDHFLRRRLAPSFHGLSVLESDESRISSLLFLPAEKSHGARALISSECTRIVRQSHSPFRASSTSHGSFGNAQCILQVAKRRVFFVQSSGRTGGSQDTRDAFKGCRWTKRVSMLTPWWIQGARNKGKREGRNIRSREW